MIDTADGKGEEETEKDREGALGRERDRGGKGEEGESEMLVFWEGASSGPKTDGSSAGYHLTPITLSFVSLLVSRFPSLNFSAAH